MIGVTYAVGNETFASKDLVFGWCFWSYGYDPLPLGEMDEEQTAALQQLFVGPTYPDELRSDLAEHAKTFKVKKEAERMRVATEQEAAEANAVSAADEKAADAEKELNELKVSHQRALSKLAVANLRTQEQTPQVKRVISFLLDFCFELTLSGGPVQVTVKKPDDPELAELLNGIIPFTK
jgi:hypothetical protein